MTAAGFNFGGFHTRSFDFCRWVNLGFFLEGDTASERLYEPRSLSQSCDIFSVSNGDVGRGQDLNIPQNNTFDCASMNDTRRLALNIEHRETQPRGEVLSAVLH